MRCDGMTPSTSCMVEAPSWGGVVRARSERAREPRAYTRPEALSTPERVSTVRISGRAAAASEATSTLGEVPSRAGAEARRTPAIWAPSSQAADVLNGARASRPTIPRRQDHRRCRVFAVVRRASRASVKVWFIAAKRAEPRNSRRPTKKAGLRTYVPGCHHVPDDAPREWGNPPPRASPSSKMGPSRGRRGLLVDAGIEGPVTAGVMGFRPLSAQGDGWWWVVQDFYVR